MDKNSLNFDKINFFYGIPHCHTSLSTGEGTIYEALDKARYNGLDFLIITDHNKYLKESIKDRGKDIKRWDYLNKCILKYNKKHSNFLALCGFEAKSTILGHLNIICPNKFFIGIISDINFFLLWMINDHSAIFSINHPKSTITKNLIKNPLLDKLLFGIEAYSGIPLENYKNHEKEFFSLLDKGFKLAPLNSQNNHKLNHGDSSNLTCVISYRLSKNSLLEALKKRHVFSTESKSLKLLFFINSSFMGDTLFISPKDNLTFYIKAEDNKNKILKVQIISNNGSIIKEIKDLDLNNIKYIFERQASSKETWFLCKIFLRDSKEALSSPIFLEYK